MASCGLSARTTMVPPMRQPRVSSTKTHMKLSTGWLRSGHAHSTVRLTGPRALPVRITPARLCARRATTLVRGSAEETPGSVSDTPPEAAAENLRSVSDASPSQRTKARTADSTDWIASALTRRFGLAGGLAWLGILTFGVVSEQFKTRRETYIAEQNTQAVTGAQEVVTGSGLRYTEVVRGGGLEAVGPGLLLALKYSLSIGDDLVLETKRPQVLVYGARPYGNGLCAGVEEALSTMRAGGRRRITVPPELAFGSSGARLDNGKGELAVIPPGATVKYDIELLRVSIPPS